LKPEELVCRRFQALRAYDPTRSVEALAEEVGVAVAGVVKLDGNENPYGPSPRVKRALARYPYFHIYPDPYQKALRKALAGYAGVGEESIVAGAGSDELIDLILRLFLDPGDRVINLPVIKTHRSASYSICLKNFIGATHLKFRPYLIDTEHWEELIAEMNIAYQPHLNIVDGTRIMIEGGPWEGTAVDTNLIIASGDRVAADITGLEIIKKFGKWRMVTGKDIWEQKQIKRALELGLGAGKGDIKVIDKSL